VRLRRWGAALSTGRWPIVLDLLLLTGIVWVARFWHSGGFGLYEDDYTKIPWAMGMTWGEVWHQVGEYFRTLGDNAKPLHAALIFLLSFASAKLGGLQAAYLLGFLVVAANCALFYLLLHRLSGRPLALLGGLGFAFFPADTTQAFLTHDFGLQWSVMFLLLAFHAYLSRRLALAYGLAFLILITYETPFPVLLTAPFLGARWEASTVRRAVRHTLMLLGLFGLVVLVRLVSGEARVSSLAPLSALRIAVEHMALGPLAILGLAVYRPFQTLRSLDLETVLAWFSGFILLFVWLGTLAAPARAEPASGIDLSSAVASLVDRERLSRWLASIPSQVRLLLVGAGMLVLAYPLTFTLSALESTGRATRVHMAAAAGSCLIFGVLASSGLGRAKLSGRTGWLRAGLAGLLALYLGFGLVVQRDYLSAWSLQRTFWTDLVRLAPDAGEGTVILVDPAGLTDVAQIGANTWNLPRILERIYDFPSSWPAPARVYRLRADWRDKIVTPAGLFRLDGTTVIAPPSLYGEVPPGNTILMGTTTDGLERGADRITLQGRTFSLRPPSTVVLDSLPRGPLYEWMFDR